jgi:predicted NBD/HSP70 family sugar kinase
LSAPAQFIPAQVDPPLFARAVVERAYYLLGGALAPWLRHFSATILVLGGGISAAWDTVSIPLRHGIAARTSTYADEIVIARSDDTEVAALRGAASHATMAA